MATKLLSEEPNLLLMNTSDLVEIELSKATL